MATDPARPPAGAPSAADRPVMPDGYGVPDGTDGLLPWEVVDERLRDSRVYWMATTRPDGRPHVVPRWGAWLDGRLYYDGAPTTVHARNLRTNPHCALHLEDGTRAAVLEGTAAPADPPGPALGGRISAEITRKYADDGYSPSPDNWEGEHAGGLCVFTPAKGLAWHSFPADVTRYRFGAEPAIHRI
jgi:hypothetical protein